MGLDFGTIPWPILSIEGRALFLPLLDHVIVKGKRGNLR